MKKIGDFIVYLLFRAIIFPFSVLPLGACRFIGRMIGRAWYAVDFKHRGIARKNLRIAFGNSLNDRELGKL